MMKIGRNDPCPCGSGKKFKKCCIDKPEYQAVAQIPANPAAGKATAAKSNSHSDAVTLPGKKGENGKSHTGSSAPRASLSESLTARDERLLDKAIQGAKRDRQKRIEMLAEKWKDSSAEELLQEMSRQGIRVQPDKFTELAEKAKSHRKLAKSWKLNKRADEDEVTALTKLLWDVLCPQTFRYDELGQAIAAGYAKLEDTDELEAAQIWLPWWPVIHDYAKSKGFTSVQILDEEFENAVGTSTDATIESLHDGAELGEGFLDTGMADAQISEWMLDLEMVLGNQAVQDQHWAEKRLVYVREVNETLTQSDREFLFQMRRAEGETLFLMTHLEEGDAVYERLIEDFPENAWSYIGWGDEYSPQFWKDRGIVDISKAYAIYNRGLENSTAERDAIEDRLQKLNNA